MTITEWISIYVAAMAVVGVIVVGYGSTRDEEFNNKAAEYSFICIFFGWAIIPVCSLLWIGEKLGKITESNDEETK